MSDPLEMPCRELVEHASDYLEGALALRDRTRFELHLLICDGCSDHLDGVRRTLAAVAQVAGEGPSEDARASLMRTFRDLRGA